MFPNRQEMYAYILFAKLSQLKCDKLRELVRKNNNLDGPSLA